MRKLAVISLSVLLIGGLVFIAAQPAAPQGQGGNTVTLFDPNKTDFEKTVDEGKKGDSAADWSVIKDRVFDPETCDKAGEFVGRFTFVKAVGERDGYFLLDAGLLLETGKLTLYWPGIFSEFENPTAPTSGGAITGGTGEYAGAGGTITVEEDVQRCDKTGALITLEVQP